MKLRIVLYCLIGGLPVSVAALGMGNFAWWWFSGVVLAASCVPIARYGPRGVVRQFAVIAPVLLVVTVLCLWSEALIFLPRSSEDPARELAGAAVLYSIFSLALAALARGLRLPDTSSAAVERPRPLRVAVAIPVCGLAYAFYYLVFGSIAYWYFTKEYYPEAEVIEIAERLGLWLWVIQAGRGAAMTLAVLPAIYSLRMSRRATALAIAALLWIAGGLAPLIPPSELMVPAQRVIHMVEILTQNALLGVTAVWLLRAKPRQATRVVSGAVAGSDAAAVAGGHP
jgi:hypothetical protein